MTTNGRSGGGMPGDAERDPRLDRLYRDGGREEPPARLDAAILAAARREVGAGPRPLSRLRAWRVPVSIAAVVVLSVSLVTLVREEGGGQLEQPSLKDLYSERAESVAPAPKTAVPADAPRAAKEEQARPQAPAVGPSIPPAARDDAAAGAMAGAKSTGDLARREADLAKRSAAVESQVRQPEPFQAAPPPAPVASAPVEPRQAPSADQEAGTSMGARGMVAGRAAESSGVPAGLAGANREEDRMKQQSRDSAGTGDSTMGSVMRERTAPAAKAAAPKPAERSAMKPAESGPLSEGSRADTGSAAALMKELGPQPPEKWVARIQSLRREGRKGEADDLLAEFKRRFPNHALPAELR